MKILATAIVLMVLSGCSSAEESWLRGIPATWPSAARPEELPQSTYVELPVSMLESAQESLKDNAAVELADYQAENFHRKDFSCSPGTNLYLLRAVYTNGSTGAYYLNRVGDKLWVAHMSMGKSTGTHRSALLACLPFKPVDVYVTAGGAL
jgi:hypothetical protein